MTTTSLNPVGSTNGAGAHRGPMIKSAWDMTAVADWALFLDVDGTLLEIAQRPEQVHVSERVMNILAVAEAFLGGALALISGRGIADLDRLFSPLKLRAAGLHGLERRGGDGVLENLGEAHLLDRLRGPLSELTDRYPGLLLEDKGLAMALHYRQAPDAEQEIKSFIAKLVADGEEPLTVLHGKMVVEVKQMDSNKGKAIAAFMAEPPFAGRLPVFIGDDVTDEDGFQVVNDLKGHSILVGDRSPTVARLGLPDVPTLLTWLERIAADPAAQNGIVREGL